MKEKIVSLKTAKLLKEIGFNPDTPHGWYKKYTSKDKYKWIYKDYVGVSHFYFSEDLCYDDCENFSIPETHLNEKEDYISAPTQCLAQKWLREEYNINITIVNVKITVTVYRYIIGESSEEEVGEFDSYEEALEKGLQEAIKIIKDEQDIQKIQ